MPGWGIHSFCGQPGAAPRHMSHFTYTQFTPKSSGREEQTSLTNAAARKESSVARSRTALASCGEESTPSFSLPTPAPGIAPALSLAGPCPSTAPLPGPGASAPDSCSTHRSCERHLRVCNVLGLRSLIKHPSVSYYGEEPKPKTGWITDRGERQERWLWETRTQYGAAHPALLFVAGRHSLLAPFLPPTLAQQVPQGSGRAVVPAQKKAQPRRSRFLGAFWLLQERGPAACCQAGRHHAAARTREIQAVVCIGIPVSSWMIVHLRSVLWILFLPRLNYMFGETIVILKSLRKNSKWKSEW
ncbi:uncharacterized protein LOC107203024 [Parus major]|uniref:uncharacterized protein LOC107203024 n=1 Tax=Parus major TaxID=9157 RepID=UPI000771354D|nr:uncharacterized protein LOC107203024 [Parus major]